MELDQDRLLSDIIIHNNTDCNNTLCRVQSTATIRDAINYIMDPLISIIKEHSAEHCKNKIITVRCNKYWGDDAVYISDTYLHEQTKLDVQSALDMENIHFIFKNGTHNTVQDQLRLFNYIPRITTSNDNNNSSTVHIGNNINMNNSSICIHSLF